MANLYIPKVLKDEIINLRLNNIQTNHAFRFVNYLMSKTSISKDRDKNFEVVIEIPSMYLKKNYTKDYTKFLNPLLQNNIVKREPYFCKKLSCYFKGPIPDRNKPFGYKINNQFLCAQQIEVVKINIIKDIDIETTPEYSWIIDDLHHLQFDITGMIAEIEKYDPRKYILIDDAIEDEYIRVKFENDIYTFHTKDALRLAQKKNKNLIKFKGKGYINYSIEEFVKLKTSSFVVSQLGTITNLQNKRFFAKRSEKNNRLNTNLTNMWGEFIKKGYVKLNGHQLVEIDMANTQPTLLAYLFSDIINFKKKFPEITSTFKIPEINKHQNDIKEFINKSSHGCLYEYISEHTSWSRNVSKENLLTIMFSKPVFSPSEKTMLKQIFPGLINWIDEFKLANNDHSSISIFLQKIESEIFISNIYKLLREKFLIFTKHDSILCSAKDKEMVRIEMEKILNTYNFKYILK